MSEWVTSTVDARTYEAGSTYETDEESIRRAAWEDYLNGKTGVSGVARAWTREGARTLWTSSESWCKENGTPATMSVGASNPWFNAGAPFTTPGGTSPSDTNLWGGDSWYPNPLGSSLGTKFLADDAACTGQLRWSFSENGEFGGIGPDYWKDLGAQRLDLVGDCKTTYGASASLCAVIAADYADWNAKGRYEYAPWDPTFQALRKKFYAAFATHMLGTYDTRDIMRFVQVNAEGGYTPYLLGLGYFKTAAERDAWEELMVTDAIAAGIPAGKAMVNIAQGGPAFMGFANAAAREGAEVATHGPDMIRALSFAQLIRSRYYDATYKAYRPVAGKEEELRFHTDLELLERTPATVAQYRLFRLYALSAVALGANSLLVTGSTIPSQGYGRPSYCPALSDKAALWALATSANWAAYRPCYFDYDAIKGAGAYEFFDWLNKNVGRTTANAPEAFCDLTQSGVNGATLAGADVAADTARVLAAATSVQSGKTLDYSTAVGQTYQVDASGSDTKTYESAAVTTPLVTYSGRFCDLTVDGHQAAREFRATYGAEIDTSRGQDTNPPLFDAAGFVGLTGNNSGPYAGSVYEGRTINTAAAKPGLFFQLGNAYVATGVAAGWIVKVVFSPNVTPATSSAWTLAVYPQGSSRVNYVVDTTGLAQGALHTATFSVPLSAFGNTGPSNSDLALLSKKGTAPTFVNLRVIRNDP